MNGRLHCRTHQKAISGGANSKAIDGQDGALRIRDLAGFRGALVKGVERVGSAVRAVPIQYIVVHVTPLRDAPLYKLRPPAAPKSGEPSELLADHMLPAQAGMFTHPAFEEGLQAKKPVGQG